MNYPVFRNRSFRALAWQSLAIRLRCCRHSERLITCCSGCGGASGAKCTCNTLRTRGSVLAVLVFFPKPPFLQHQEPKGQHRHGHVVVPTTPATHLVVIQAYFLLAAQKAVLDGPT